MLNAKKTLVSVQSRFYISSNYLNKAFNENFDQTNLPTGVEY